MIPNIFTLNCNNCGSKLKFTVENLLDVINLKCCPFCADTDYYILDRNGKGVK